MANPFEDPNKHYFALKNEVGQYSLWPAFLDIPAGWVKVCGPDERSVCLEYISVHWTDLQPKETADSGSGDGNASL